MKQATALVADDCMAFVYCVRIGTRYKLGTTRDCSTIPSGERPLYAYVHKAKALTEEIIIVFELEGKRQGRYFNLNANDILWMGSMLRNGLMDDCGNTRRTTK